MSSQKLISFKCPEAYLDGLNELVRAGIYPSRSEAIRIAIRDLLRRELWEANSRVGKMIDGAKIPAQNPYQPFQSQVEPIEPITRSKELANGQSHEFTSSVFEALLQFWQILRDTLDDSGVEPPVNSDLIPPA